MDIRDFEILLRIAREARLDMRLDAIFDMAYAMGTLEKGMVERPRRLQLERDMQWE